MSETDADNRVSEMVRANRLGITITELRQHPGEILTQVASGKIFLITKHWKPIAVLSKPPGVTLTTVIDGNGQVRYAT